MACACMGVAGANVHVSRADMGMTGPNMAVRSSAGNAEEGKERGCHGAAHQAGEIHRVHVVPSSMVLTLRVSPALVSRKDTMVSMGGRDT
jgi:hypothetical protein